MNIQNNIFLIGMMGSWKSTVGKKISNVLNMNYLDTDDKVESSTGYSIKEIFTYKGEDYFRDVESKIFVEKSLQKGFVISTGGGIVLRRSNRFALKSNGITFFLKASPETLSCRIKNTNKRPLLDDEEPIIKLSKIWKERKGLYLESCHHIIDTDKDNPQEVSQKILDLLKK